MCGGFKNALLPLKSLLLLLWKGIIESLGYHIKMWKFTEYLFESILIVKKCKCVKCTA